MRAYSLLCPLVISVVKTRCHGNTDKNKQQLYLTKTHNKSVPIYDNPDFLFNDNEEKHQVFRVRSWTSI